MQIQAGTARLRGRSDQSGGPLGATPTIRARTDVAWPQVGEWKKIIEKLMRAKVRAEPSKGAPYRHTQVSPCACFVLPAARLWRGGGAGGRPGPPGEKGGGRGRAGEG